MFAIQNEQRTSRSTGSAHLVVLLGLSLLFCGLPLSATAVELVIEPSLNTFVPKGWIMKQGANQGAALVVVQEKPGADDSPSLMMIKRPTSSGGAEQLFATITQPLKKVEIFYDKKLTKDGTQGRFVEFAATTDKGLRCKMSVFYVTSQQGVYLVAFVAPIFRYAMLGGAQLMLNFAGITSQGRADQGLRPSAHAVKIARRYGLSSPRKGTAVAGPFDASDGMIFYIDKAGRLSVYNPKTNQAFFGTLEGGRWRYTVGSDGYRNVQGSASTKPNATAPAALARWPLALELSTQISKTYKKTQKRRRKSARSSRAGRVPWGIMSAMSRQMHQTNMTVISNIGGGGCYDRYSGSVWVGCW